MQRQLAIRIVAIAVFTLLAGCAAKPASLTRAPTPPSDNCAEGSNNAFAVVVVALQGNTPVAVPDPCHVRERGKIWWVSAEGARETFTVKFTADTPDDSGAVMLKGQRQADRRPFFTSIGKTKPRKDGGVAANTYNYDISIGGASADPSIIIDEAR